MFPTTQLRSQQYLSLGSTEDVHRTSGVFLGQPISASLLSPLQPPTSAASSSTDAFQPPPPPPPPAPADDDYISSGVDSPTLSSLGTRSPASVDETRPETTAMSDVD